ncbi:MAG: hypothetical protein KAQ84_04545 [Thermoplasmatales archaeon]|nr:hypothetical protein [Thermoplasmatales archaeon]
MGKRKKELCVEGEALELLKQLLQKGFIYTGNNRNKLRFLQKIFPVIKRSQFKNRVLCNVSLGILVCEIWFGTANWF